MIYKKTNEAWFGDSFNRDSTTCSYTIANNDLKSIIDSVDLVTSGSSNAVYGVTNAGGEIVKTSDYAIECVTDSFATEIKRIEAQINDLKQNFVPKKGANKLRSALKTLNYTREL